MIPAAILLTLLAAQSIGTANPAITGTPAAARSSARVDGYLFLFGDSKTSGAAATWPTPLLARAERVTGQRWVLINKGLSGATVATTITALPGYLATIPPLAGVDIRVLINLGVNDITTTLPAEATWNANYLAILDALIAKWPTARVYLMRPWLHGNPSPSFDTECDTVAARITTIVAARSSVAFVGPDERVWLKGSDVGVTMTTDLTHYSAPGNDAAVVQWAAVLWP